MKNILPVLSLLILLGCGKSGDQKVKINENPTQIDDVQKLTYNSQDPDIFLVNENNHDNYLNLELAPNQVTSVNLKIKANLVAGEVKTINTSNDIVLNKNCVKPYSANEECVIQVPISSTLSGFKLIRIASNLGNRFFSLNIKRVSSVAQASLAIKGSTNFGLLSEEQKIIKSFSITNLGNGIAEDLSLAIGGKDPGGYQIIYNSCEGKDLAKNKTCYVKILFTGSNKTVGSFTSKLKVQSSGGSIDLGQMSSQINSSSVNNNAPVITTNNISAVVGTALSFPIQASDLDGDSLVYSIESSLPVTVSNSGIVSFTPQASQVGVHNLQVTVSDNKSPGVVKTIPLKIYNDLNLVGSTSFVEGEIRTPLLEMTLNIGSPIASISSNLKSFLTPVAFSGSAVSGQLNPGMNNNFLPLVTPNSGNVGYYISGAVKNAGNYELLVQVTLQNGEVIDFKRNIVVTSSSLPILKYDLWAVKYSSGTGFDGDYILESIGELHREYLGWRTPILTQLKHQPLICNQVEMTTFDASNQSHLNCLKNNSSDDAETGFIFNGVYSGARQIGGIANGTRDSFVIEKYPWSYTLAHEMGHQFGLWHTFESYWNDYLIHCNTASLDSCYLYNVYENIPNRNLNIVGDWANFLVNFAHEDGVVPYNYVVADDTSIDYFNGAVATINNLYHGLYGGIYNNAGGYVNGDQVLIYKGGQSYLSAQGSFACYQLRGTAGSIANGQPYNNPVICPSIPGRPTNYIIPENTVKNTMSYWFHEDNSARFSPNQKIRMDEVISDFPELSTP